jgi:hypothetical protein
LNDDAMPVDGEALSPDCHENQLDEDVFKEDIVDTDLVSALRSSHMNKLLTDSNCPSSNASPIMTVKAVAGPMSQQQVNLVVSNIGLLKTYK